VPEVRTSDFSVAPGVIAVVALILAAGATLVLARVLNHLGD
jgi:hypothetical protein